MRVLGLLWLAPWRRGPLLLLRRPGVAVALFAAALAASLPAAAAPLFLSSAQHATLHRQIEQTCPGFVGVQFSGPVAPFAPETTFGSVLGPDSVVGEQRFHGRHEAVASSRAAGLTPAVSTGHGTVDAELVGRPLPFPDLRGLTLLARDGFEDHVEVLEGPFGEGLWLPHERAHAQGIEVGDELRLTPRSREHGTWAWGTEAESRAVTLPVAAIYRDLRAAPDTPYWCGVSSIYRGPPDPSVDPPPPAALMDTATFLAVGQELQIVAGQVLEAAVANPDLTAPEAQRLAADIEIMRAGLFEQQPALFPTEYSSDETEFVSFLDRYGQRSQLVRTGLLPPVLPITAAGMLVGLAVAGAAAVFWVQRRRQELAVLAAHGVGASALGFKAAVETLPAVIAGAAAGWAAAWALVTGVGPSPVLAPSALPLAAVAAGAVGLVALLLIGGLAASGARGLADARPVSRGVRWWQRFPWELGLVAAAPAAWVWLADDQVVDQAAGGVGTVTHVPARLLVVPILVIAGVAVFAARLAAAMLRRHGLAYTPRKPAVLVAWRRSVRVAAATAILAAATAMPVAMAIFGAAATGSIRTTADAQLRFNLGSDTVVSYPRPIDREPATLSQSPVPEQLAGRASEVLRLNQQRLDGLTVDVIAVDPETFTDGAFWDDRIPGQTLADAVGELSAGADPVVVASRRVPPGPATLRVHDAEIPVTIATTRPLPGAQAAYPLVLVHRDVLENQLSERGLRVLTPQVWIAGDPQATLAQIGEMPLPAARVVTIDDHRAGAVYEPVTYTFQYLIALSVFTGLIGAVGLLLYLESRTTAHRRGYVMLRRMGLTPGVHRRALILEICAPVLAGLAAGAAAAVAIAYTLRSGFDLNHRRFPDALVELPGTMAIIVVTTALGIAIAASLLAHARIARANPAEVLRETN